MEEYEKFRKLSLGAFSCDSLPLAEAALRIIQKRYPNIVRSLASEGPSGYPSLEEVSNSKVFIAETPTEWTEYACRISSFSPRDGDKVTPSMWQLARGDHLNAETVEAYLNLLRPKSLYTQISEIRNLREGMNEIGDEGLDRPTIIPFRDGDHWAFAVAYSDCIHWYDSRPHNNTAWFSTRDSRHVATYWTGPKQLQTEDSGIIMLLGTRCIQQGTPHLSQRVTDDVISSFRSRVLVELLCESIDPSDEEFNELLTQEKEEQSLFFNDAIHGIESEFVANVETPVIPLESHEPTSPLVSRESSQSPQPSTPTPERPSHYTSSVVSRKTSRIVPDDRRDILEHLSEAVLIHRSIGASRHTDLAVLWHSVKRGRICSTFHERYNAVLFFDKMEQLQDKNAVVSAMNHPIDRQCVRDMRSMQSQCKFWKDLCDLHKEWDIGKYTLLLAVPSTISARNMRDSHKLQLISKFRSRLADASDPLERWLRQADDLCNAVVNRSLPKENLMIDLYHLKQNEAMTDVLYGAFTSLNPRVKLPLSRGGNSRSMYIFQS